MPGGGWNMARRDLDNWILDDQTLDDLTMDNLTMDNLTLDIRIMAKWF
jgi:hypothetical protein